MIFMSRVATGISGFDDLVEGGFPEGTNILLTGVPGAGKTMFGLEYLYRGALKGEAGIYISTDSSLPMIRQQAKRFGWDVESLEKKGKLMFLQVPLDEVKFDLFKLIEKAKNDIDAKRIVFDNLATFTINLDLFEIPVGYAGIVSSGKTGGKNSLFGGEKENVVYTGNSEERMIFLILGLLRKLGTTNLVITFGDSTATKLTIDGVSEFDCDGIVSLHNELVGAKRIRTLEVFKMRDTDHSPYIHDLEITKNGMVVKAIEPVEE